MDTALGFKDKRVELVSGEKHRHQYYADDLLFVGINGA